MSVSQLRLQARPRHWVATTVLWLTALVAPASALADKSAAQADGWRSSKDRCLAAMAEPDKAEETTVQTCADLFAADAVLSGLTGPDRSKVEKGLRWLYERGNDTAARIARGGLSRLGIELPARAPRGNAGSSAGGSAPERPRYDPPEARSAERDDADRLYKEGVAALKKKKWRQGVEALQAGLQKNPRSEKILYNLACGKANLPGQEKAAVQHLQQLADLGTDSSGDLLIKARQDEDLEPVREDPQFKAVTGYLRIQVINTCGDAGDPGVDNLMKLFDKLGHKKPDKRVDDSGLEHPVLQFKPHAKAQTGFLAEQLNDPQTRLDPMTADSKYDLVVRWGTAVKDGKPVNLGPDTADEAVAKARKKQNEVLAQPEQTIHKVNKVVDTPNRVITETGRMKDRAVGTVKKAEGAVEKVKDLDKLGDKIKGL
jgi:hypothetical protein